MTLKEAYAIGNIIHNEVISFYEQQFDEIFKKCNIYPKFKSFRGNIHIRSKLIDKIYVDHETELRSEYRRLEGRDFMLSEMQKELKTKNEEIEKLKTNLQQYIDQQAGEDL